ncbi:MAG: 3-oxoadipate--succinyl-CoA transferase subunit B [Acidimicrobiaceae bacterium]|nr:3-oxoadipate--succinyl-CoA transferase subunit B [Acidimicrobiaceae bacterium]
MNNELSTDWTVDELMITSLSATLDNDDQACNGMASFIPVIAFQLARLTHAPDLVWVASAIGLDARPERVPASTLEAPLWRDSIMYLEQYSTFWDIVLKGSWLQKFCVGAAQLDRYGNGNNSVIGDDYHRPKVRLPGTAGLGDMGSIGKRLFFWNPNHNPRSFVEKVDFVSCAGWLGGGDERERLGLTGGPELVITNLCVMDFHPETKHMRLKSVHPGVTAEEVQDATGFELLIGDSPVPETAVPTVEQVDLIRDVIDPDGMRLREFGR